MVGLGCILLIIQGLLIMRASLRTSASTAALAPQTPNSSAVVRDFKDHASPMAEEEVVGGLGR